jgi:redox-sensitive bicupin YhaK (pirin superfamily)
VRRSADRFHTVAPGLDSRPSFSYGPHYDPDNLGFGVLVAHNEDRLSPAAGFPRHAHRGLDIVTWVLSGTLEHEHWTGAGDAAVPRRERLGPGTAQVLRTGTAVDHAEHAGAGSADVSPGAHYLQMWLTSAAPGADPGYQRHDFTPALNEAAAQTPARVVTVASGRAEASAGPALTLSQPAAEFSVARLPAGTEIELAPGPLVHVFLARGVLAAPNDRTQPDLAAGDALRLRAAPAQVLRAVEASEILVWHLPP